MLSPDSVFGNPTSKTAVGTSIQATGPSVLQYSAGELLFSTMQLATGVGGLGDLFSVAGLNTGSLMQAQGPSTLGFTNFSTPTDVTAGDLWYGSAAETLSALAVGSNGQVLAVVTGVPAWASISSIITSANPSASVGLTAVDGTAATFMTSDSAPALSQSITPTWTGQHIFTVGSNESAIVVNAGSIGTTGNVPGVQINAPANQYGLQITGSSTSGQSYGFAIASGTGSSDQALTVANQADNKNYFYIRGDGYATFGNTNVNAAIESSFSVTINTTTTQTGAALALVTTAARGSGQNYIEYFDPTGAKGYVGYGSTSNDILYIYNAMNAAIQFYTDGTIAGEFLSGGGFEIFVPSAGNALTVSGLASAYAGYFQGATVAGTSFGLVVDAGTNSSDICAEFNNEADTTNYLIIRGDGVVIVGVGLDATTAVQLGAAASNTVGFYGKTPAAQTASTTAMQTTNVVSSSVYNSTANQKMVAVLQEVINVLFAIGIYATH